MKKIVIVTQIEFWKCSRGSQSRIRELIKYLECNCKLTILCLAEQSFDFKLAKKVYPKLNIVALYPTANQQKTLSILSQFFHEKLFDSAIIEYLQLHWVVDLLPKDTLSILDSHDILSLRAKSFREHNRKAYYDVTEEQEFLLFKKFNKIMFIQDEELQTGIDVLKGTSTTALLCPHPVTCQPVNGVSNNIVGFFGSAGQANVDSLHWLNDEIVPLVKTPNLTFAVYGEIVLRKQLVQRCDRLKFFNLVENIEDFYSKITISVNPVLFGGGLKIKCVEALAFGVPLITTRIGAQGLIDQAKKSFLLASDATEFAAHIDALFESELKRERLRKNGLSFMKSTMSPEACFSILLK